MNPAPVPPAGRAVPPSRSRWWLGLLAAVSGLSLAGYAANAYPLTPFDFWYPPVPVLWISLISGWIVGLGGWWWLRHAPTLPPAPAAPTLRAAVIAFLTPFGLLALLSSAYLIMSPLLVPGVNWWATPALLLGLIPLGILAIGGGSYLIRRRNGRHWPPPLLPITRRSVLVALGLGLSLGLSSGEVFTIYNALYTRPTVAAAATWTELTDFAARLATRIDATLILESASAEFLAYPAPTFTPDTVFRVALVFRRPDGSSIRMEVADTTPPRLLRLYRTWDSTESAGTPARLVADAQALRFIQLSPREVYRQTYRQAQAAQPTGGLRSPDIRLFLEQDWQMHYGIPAVWSIDYATAEHRLVLRIHPQTGAILLQQDR